MKTTAYLHASRDSMYDLGEKLGFKGEVLRNFSFACYEVTVTLEVNESNGNADDRRGRWAKGCVA